MDVVNVIDGIMSIPSANIRCMDEEIRTAGEILRDAYEDAGFNQTTFAEALGYDQTTVSKWVTGERKYNRRRPVQAIARVLNYEEIEVYRWANVKRTSRRGGKSSHYTSREITEVFNRLDPDEQDLFIELMDRAAKRSGFIDE